MKLVKETIYDVLTNETEYIYYTDEEIEVLKQQELDKLKQEVEKI